MIAPESFRVGQDVRIADALPEFYDQTLAGAFGKVHIVHVDSIGINVRGVIRRLPFSYVIALPKENTK